MNEEVEYFFRGRSRLAAAMDSSAHDMSEDEVKVFKLFLCSFISFVLLSLYVCV